MTDIAINMGQIIEAHNFGSKKKKKKMKISGSYINIYIYKSNTAN